MHSGQIENKAVDMSAIRAAASDLDHTLLNEESRLSEYTIKTISEWVDAGYEFYPATGRCFASLPDDVRRLESIRYIITSNGANISDIRTGEAIYLNCIKKEMLEPVLDVILDRSILKSVFVNGRAYVDAAHFDALNEIGSQVSKRTEYSQLKREIVPDINKLIIDNADNRIENINLIFSDNEKQRECYEKIKDAAGLTYVYAEFKGIQIGSQTTSKSSAIAWMLAKKGLTLNNLVAFGDSANDIAMVKDAGIGVAVGNAKQSVKDIADVICGTNDDDGPAHLMKEILLQ